MRLAGDAAADYPDSSSSSRAEASGGIIIADSLSGFPSDSEAEDEDNRITGRSADGHAAFKHTRKRE
jgi:hypothetical protein